MTDLGTMLLDLGTTNHKFTYLRYAESCAQAPRFRYAGLRDPVLGFNLWIHFKTNDYWVSKRW